MTEAHKHWLSFRVSEHEIQKYAQSYQEQASKDKLKVHNKPNSCWEGSHYFLLTVVVQALKWLKCLGVGSLLLTSIDEEGEKQLRLAREHHVSGWIGPGALCEHLLVNKGKRLKQPKLIFVFFCGLICQKCFWVGICSENLFYFIRTKPKDQTIKPYYLQLAMWI